MPSNLAQKIRASLLHRGDGWVVRFPTSRDVRKGPVARGSELHRRALSVAAGLRDRGLLGGPVMLAAPNSPEFVAGLLGAIYAGVPVVPVPVPSRAVGVSRIEGIVGDCGARVLLCSAESRGALEGHVGSIEGVAPLEVVGLEELHVPEPATEPAGFRADADDVAVIQYTSGSTRQPAGVLVRHANVLASAELQRRHWNHDEGAVLVSWMPNYHDLGLFGGYVIPLMNGSRIVTLRTLSVVKKPVRWLQAISVFGGTISGAPPFAFSMCTDRISPEESDGLDLSSWEVAFCGADTVPADVLEAFRDRFGPHGLDRDSVLACYGLAEATIYAAGARPEVVSPPPPAASAGPVDIAPCLVPEAMREGIRIVDPDTGRPVPDGEEGEIRLSGAHVCSGYHGQPARSEAVFRGRIADAPGPWLKTGDLGLLSDGRLWVTGRLKDVLVCNGMNVPAHDVEWLAASHHDALNPLAAAAFHRDPLGGDAAVLYLETRGRRAVVDEVEAVKRRIRGDVGRTFGLDLVEIRFVPRGTLERTSSGKVRRSAVAARHRGATATPAAAG